MHSGEFAYLQDLLKKQEKSGPLSAIAREAIKNNAVDPAALATMLTKGGLGAYYKPGKAGIWCILAPTCASYDEAEKKMLARGYSKTKEDALLRALYGAVVEAR